MELMHEFRKMCLCVCLMLFVGNVKAQVGEGVALGLSGDLMMDTAFGELPNPLLTMGNQGGQPSTVTSSQTSNTNTGQSAGGGFNVNRFSVLGTNTAHTMFPIDASRIAGVANGQTIYLPGIFGNQLYSGSPVVIPAHSTSSSSTADPNQKYMLQNEDFTALGNIGNHVRVPVPNYPALDSASANNPATDKTFTINPTDIIGVADMNQIGPDGNPSFISFNPGTGHASEISALQSALQGTAVDMSAFLPPPFDSPSSSTDIFPSGSSTSSSTSSSSSTQENTNFDLLLEAGPSFLGNSSSTDFQGVDAATGINNPSISNSAGSNANSGSIFSTMTSSQDIQTTNENFMYDTLIDTGSSQTTTKGKPNLGGQFDNTMDGKIVGLPSIFVTNKPTGSGFANTFLSGVDRNEQSMTTSNEQSMLTTSGLSGGDRLNSNKISTGNMNEQSMFGTNTKQIISNDQSMPGLSQNTKSVNSNEESMFGTETTRLDTKFQSNANANKQSMLSTGSSINEQSMFAIDAKNPELGLDTSAGLNINNNEQSMFDTGQFADSSNTNTHSLNINKADMYNKNDKTPRTTIGHNSKGDNMTEIAGRASASTNDLTRTMDQQSNTFVENRGRDNFGQTDNFAIGQGSKTSLMEGQNNAGRMNVPSISSNVQTNKMENTVQSTDKISIVDTNIHPPSIIPNTLITKDQNPPFNEPSYVNVGARIGLRNGSSDAAGSLNGLLGTSNSNGGSRFSNFNDGITGSQVGGGEKQYLKSGSGVNTLGDTSLATNVVDSIQSSSDGTGVSKTMVDNTLSTNNDNQLTIPLADHMLSVSDSNLTTTSNKFTSVTDASSHNKPHLNELNTSGIYPFEGSLTAMDATLAEGASASLDMSSVLDGREPLHLEPSVNIVGEVVSDTSQLDATGSNTGIFAVVGDSYTGSAYPNGLLIPNSDRGPQNSLYDLSMNDNSSSVMKNGRTTSDISFVNGGTNDNTLAIDNINQYVGLESRENKKKLFNGNLERNVVQIDNQNPISLALSQNNNRLTNNEQRKSEASNLANGHTKELPVVGNINNNIITFNKIDVSSNTVTNKDNTITDGIGIGLSSFSGAPLTNMAGALTGTSRGGLTVNADTINNPSLFISTETSDFSSSSNQESSSVSGISDIPSGSFEIGAGQPNSKIIDAGSFESLSTSNSNVGGIALGSNVASQNSNIQSISLPESAFKSNKMINTNQKQPITEAPKLVKVDMSSFVPPPYEDPTLTNSLNTRERNIQTETSRSNTVNSEASFERQNRIDQMRNKLNPVSLEVPQSFSKVRDNVLNQGAFNREKLSNTALLNRIDNLRNQVTSNDGTTIVRQFNEHVKNDAASNGGISGRSSKNSSSGEQSNFVTSTEHFGKPLRQAMLTQEQQNTKTSSFNSLDQSALPSIVVDRAIFTDLGKDTNMRANEVAVALDIHNTQNQDQGIHSSEQYTSQPIVGSIFGTVENSSSNSLTQRFLEKSGITREPAVDFMTTFLQHSKPTRTLNRGNKSLQIVPLGSDMTNLSPNTDKIIISGRQNDAQTVDKFGVADIYTRKQQLNPSQWQQLMAKVSHEPTSNQKAIDVGYLTQNVIGTGEIRPLMSKNNQGLSITRRGISSGFTSNTNTRNVDRLYQNEGTGENRPLMSKINQETSITRRGISSGLTSNTDTRNVDRLNQFINIPSARKNTLRSATLFEAPGITGHKSVTIRNYFPLSSKRHSASNTINSRENRLNDVGQQSLQEFVGTQTTAEKTSSFANTFRKRQKTGIEGVPVLNQNGHSISSVSLPLNNRISSGPEMNSQGQLGDTGKKIQNEMNTFKLGRSILISDGVIPEFTGPNSVQRLPIDTNDLRSLSANGMRLGQPSFLPNGGSVTMDQVSNQQTTVESSQTSSGSVDMLGSPQRIGRVGSLAMNTGNNKQLNLGTLDSEMTGILQSRMSSIDSQMSNNHKTATGSFSSQLANNRPTSIASLDAQSRNNPQNGAGTFGSLNSEKTNARLSQIGSLQRNKNNQLDLRTLDSQLLNNRPSRLGSLESQVLSNRQSTALQSDSQKSSTGEITLQDIQGSAIAREMGSIRQRPSLSNRLGIAIGGNLNAGLNGGQGQENIGIAINGNMNNAITTDTHRFTNTASSSIEAGQMIKNTGSNVGETGIAMPATNIEQRNLDTATILGLNSALKKQPMEATLFTSGSRFAVFGRADDATGRSLGASMQTKPIPARRMGVLGPIHDCRYKPDPTSEYYFVYKNGITQHRFRCALGTAFDEMTCECSIRVSDHGDCLEVHMDFNNGVVEDSSLNRLPIGNENVEITNNTSPIAGIALFGGDGQLTIWRYQNYDFRDHIMLKVQFRPGVGGDRLQPLISNCDIDSPSVGIIYDNVLNEVILMLQTVNDTGKELRFRVNPDEWNDVTYIYDGQEFIGIVNGVRRYVSRENPHLLGIIGGEIKSTPAQGLIEIRDAAIVLGHCPLYGYYRGAMVDIQVYTCIPKDFRLE